jgi:RHS repeat-associated protein
MQKNNLFAAYMNSHLGYSKEAWEYKEFIDSCAVHPDAGGTTVCKPFTNGDGPRMTTQYADGNNQIKDIARTKTNGYIMAGIANANVAANADGYLIRTDSLGQVIWAKKYGGDQNDRFLAVKATADSGFIAIGTTYSYCYDNGAMLIVKVDGEGNVKWNKTVDVDATTGAAGSSVIELADGSYGFSGTSRKSAGGAAFNEMDWITGVLSHEGDLQWMKRWGSDLNAGYVVSPTIHLIENKDTIVAASSTTHTGGNLNVVVFKASKTTGALIDTKSYELEKGLSNLISIAKTPAGYKMTIINFPANASTGSFAALDIAEGGGIIRATHLLRGGLSGAYRTVPTPEGGLIMTRFDYNSPQHFYWYKLAPDNSLIWANHVKGDGPMRFIEKLLLNPNGTMAGAGMLGNANFAPSMLTLTSSVGKGSCKDVVTDTTAEIISAVAGKGTAEDLSIQLALSDRNISTIPLLERVSTLTRNIVGCAETENCYKLGDGMMLCGNAEPVYAPVDVNAITNCSDSTFFAVSAGKVMYRAYIDSVKNDFDLDYTAKALSAAALEQFAVTYGSSEYHYTLYYYDQAGNLVKTVPPAGVVKNRTKVYTDQVAAARAKGLRLVPQHKMTTTYRYNTLNELVAQNTPDGGRSRFWYDRIGRTVLSQNAQQALSNHYSYTQYDNIGRVVEVGELTNITPMTNELSRKASTLASWINASANSKTQITQTIYDQPLTPLNSGEWQPANLRNRVSWSLVYNTYADVLTGNYTTGSFYNYDVLGNVKTLMQDYKTIITSNQLDRLKKINYNYDLISGKVNLVSYQQGKPDAFYHRFTYDALNRITGVATSRDSVYWENEAYYKYYKHGPMARAIIGQQQVQGIDYVYTLNGWLKGINSNAVSSEYDPGGDGGNGNTVARDAYGFALHYYNNSEYSAINSMKTPFASITLAQPLFNGNISAVSQNIPKLGEPLLSSYSYDVLNRLSGMQVFKGLSISSNTWVPSPLTDFKESITYDANGNILTYDRNGNKSFANKPLEMDKLIYNYKTGTNQLLSIRDAVDPLNYDNDIDDQQANNYGYDAIGNLVKDVANGIDSIKWTAYGRISRIKKSDGVIISYSYDIAGNRISKVSKGVQTWYVRDINGNVISVYTKDDPNVNGGALTQVETHIYAGRRLGISRQNLNLSSSLATVELKGNGTASNIDFIRGKKSFELTNYLGNVMATVSDKKLGISVNGSIIDYYIPDILSAQEYSPFGMQLVGRVFSRDNYRYGFSGKEVDNDVKGKGNQLDFGARIYDSRIGKWMSTDPLQAKYPEISPYSFTMNNPIFFTDPDGREVVPRKGFMETIWGTVYKKLAGNTQLATVTAGYTRSKAINLNLGTREAVVPSYAKGYTSMVPNSGRVNNATKPRTLLAIETDIDFTIERAKMDVEYESGGTKMVAHYSLTEIVMVQLIIHEAIHAKIIVEINGTAKNDEKHNGLAAEIKRISDGLKEYNQKYQLGYSDEDLEMLSWGGAFDSDAYKKLITDRATDKKTNYDDEDKAFRGKVREMSWKMDSKEEKTQKEEAPKTDN